MVSWPLGCKKSAASKGRILGNGVTAKPRRITLAPAEADYLILY